MEITVQMRRCVLAIGALLLASAPLAAPRVCADVPPINAPLVESPAPAPNHLLDRVAEFFRYPIVYVALLTVGVIGLIFEFKLPGTTLPGSVAAICFVLFFWAYSFVGQFTLLAILLFLLGLVLLGVEVFVVPGLGFSGIAGVALMFIGLLLVTLAHWPHTPNDWANVGSTFGSIAIALAMAVAGALALTWSLPNVPLLQRMVLKPPVEEEATHLAVSLSNSGALALLGAIGVAATPLRPSGKAQFGEQFLDVIAEGEYVPPGGRVKVIEIEGSRVVVKEV
jgi:membrane-bound serine protease (ClpP class)